MRLVLASNNAKKLAELQALFAPLDVELVTQGSLGIAEAEEPHVTFVENALAEGSGMRRSTQPALRHCRRLGPVRRCAGRLARRAVGALRHAVRPPQER